jgi:erythromycin esterase-like protein
VLIIRPMMAIALILAAAGAAAAAPARPAMPASALEAAVRDLCGRYVALLGEADHGDGRAVEFKVALVRRLVTQ